MRTRLIAAAVATAALAVAAPAAAAGPPGFHPILRTVPAKQGDSRRACLTRLPRVKVAGAANTTIRRLVPVACEMPPRWYPKTLHLANPIVALLGG